MKRILITGATGMIAVALVRFLLLQDNHPEIYCVIRPNSKKVGDIPVDSSVHIIECDLKDLSKLPGLLPGSFDIFYHFGWDGTFGDSRNDALLQMDNIKCTLDAVNAAKALGCECFIGAGSQAEYGRTEEDLGPETPVNPENGYGIAKYAAGKLSRLLCQNLGIRHIWVRILSIYGPHDGVNTMIMSCIRSFLKNERMSLTKGEQLWDYLHCDDAARALYLIAEKGLDGAVYPLGSGIGRALSEYVLAIRDAISPDLQPGLGDRPYSENQVMRLRADISTLTRDTGFLPEIEFEDGIKKTIDWVNRMKKEH